MQASVLDGFAFDPFSFQQDGLTASEVDVGRCKIVDALVVAPWVADSPNTVPIATLISRSVTLA